LGFNPDTGSKAGNATCPFCGTVADSDYVKTQGCAKRIGYQLMAVACTGLHGKGKTYVSADNYPDCVINEELIRRRLDALCKRSGLSVPTEGIVDDSKNSFWVRLYGLTTYGDLFSMRQLFALMSFLASIHEAENKMATLEEERRLALLTFLATMLDRLADFSSTLCVWNCLGWGESTAHTFGRQALPMTWDFSEINPFSADTAGWPIAVERVLAALPGTEAPSTATVLRGSATELPWKAEYFDAVLTDPPYYDNVSYADLSDYFYVWLKRSVGRHFPEHFATEGTPKRGEAVADAARHSGSKQRARHAYEDMMATAFSEAHRVMKPGAHLTVVYAHKTTLGWATLVDALRRSGFTVSEAWPLDTEKPGRLKAIDVAALASSIFLIARKREGAVTGGYEQVRPELEGIVRERVDSLWDMGISGADLVIASVGAGLRAFTRFARVEYANGEEVPAERFLFEVETVVLETVLSRLSKEVGGEGGQYSLANLDTSSRFYVLWRYTYGVAELDAGEAIIFANGTHVELDGPHGLTTGTNALVEKKKGKYRLRDFNDRGEHERLGLPGDIGQAAPLVDALQRTLWLMEKRPTELSKFLREAQPNREALRLIAQALAGPALKGGEMGDISPTAELSALAKLTANWQSVVEDAAQTTGEKEERKKGQKQLI
jgi:putative DNA methylase